MPFNIIRNDITKLNVDAIVNAANSRLMAGGGVCGAIFNAAGEDKLQKACDEIGYCDVGEAVITKGFDLKAKYIIHTVGPMYGKDPLNEEVQLYSCYKNSLELAKKNGVTSIAFPLISSGIYGYPKTEALKIASRAIRDFLAENDMQVYLVVYDKSSFQISEKLFFDVKSYIDERVVKTDDRRIEKVFYTQSVKHEIAALDNSFKAIPKMSAGSLTDFLNVKTETFSEMLLRLIDEKGMTDVEVYKCANIDRKLFSKIRNNTNYKPSKSTALAFAFALELDIDETKEAGFALSHSSKFDVIVEYFLINQNYNVFELNEVLFAFDQPLIGA